MKDGAHSPALTLAALLFTLLFAIDANAHHSRSEYNLDVPIEISGEIVAVSWRNPHVTLRLKTTDENGEEALWYMESASAAAMISGGVPAGVLKPGMHVTVVGGASTRRANRMEATNILMPDGLEVVLGMRFSAHWSGPVTGPRQEIRGSTPTGSFPDDGRGIFRVWTWGPTPKPWMTRPPEDFSLTEKAKRAAATWDENDPADNLQLLCTSAGMPGTMGNVHPMELVQLADTIQIRNQELDVVRTVHMDSSTDPDSIAPSPLGYSVGRWEGDTLVINTTRINAPYFNRRGVPQSEAVEIEERFTGDAESGRLNYLLTVTDPEYLAEPFVQEVHWNWIEGAVVQTYDCTVPDENVDPNF